MLCPKCGSELDYPDGYAMQETQVSYLVSCPACGFTGKEWYDLIFSTFTDDDGNDIPRKTVSGQETTCKKPSTSN